MKKHREFLSRLRPELCARTWAARLLLCSQHAFSSAADLPLRSLLLLHLVSAVSNKEEISVSSWPANRGAIEEFMECVLFAENAGNWGWREQQATRPLLVLLSRSGQATCLCSGRSFIVWILRFESYCWFTWCSSVNVEFLLNFVWYF